MEYKNSNFWSIFGKIAVLAGFLWAVTQLYNYYIKKEYDAEANGKHCFYQTPSIILRGYKNSLDYKAVINSMSSKDLKIKFDIDTLVKEHKSDYQFDELFTKIDTLEIKYNPNKDYGAFWYFTVTNNGNKSLEELALELPFEGYSKVFYPNSLVNTSVFKNKISLGELRPSYSIKIYCWINDPSYDDNYSYYEEEKSRFTHKNGWFKISYPVEANGLYAWNKRNYNGPFIVFCCFLYFSFIVIYKFGKVKGAEKKEIAVNIPEISKKS
ncbi:hypothetical protein [Flavobacterium sp.]|uniref:hypothetical protein n=1 Tax=Flavobacterium sp. TaxID=239 RepID=UPI0037536F45